MKSCTIYRSSRAGVLECAAFADGKMMLHTSMAKDVSAPVMIETAHIRLKSDYDSEQTLIPGVTKRTVFYAGKNIRFADIRWNRDETYTIDFGDETFDAVRNDADSFSFFADDASIGKISRDVSGVSGIVRDDVRYEPSYTVEYDENISQQALIMIMVFPILYFGF